MKTKKGMKIFGIVIASIVLAITAATIVLALVPKKLYNPIPEDNFAGVTVYRSTLSNSYYGDESAEGSEANQVIDDLLGLIGDSVQDNVLSSIFQGALGFDRKVNAIDKETDLKKYYDASGVLALVFNYLDDVQTLTVDGTSDGEVYKHITPFASKTVEYNKIIMPIINTDSYEENTIYLVKDNACEYTITYHAHQSKIYDYIINDDKMDWPLFESSN